MDVSSAHGPPEHAFQMMKDPSSQITVIEVHAETVLVEKCHPCQLEIQFNQPSPKAPLVKILPESVLQELLHFVVHGVDDTVRVETLDFQPF